MYTGALEKFGYYNNILQYSNEVFQFFTVKYGMGTVWQTFGIKRFPIFPLLFSVTRWGVLLA